MSSSAGTKQTVDRQREIKKEVTRADREKSGNGSNADEAPRTGARAYPVPPFPRQQLDKPGHEHRLEPAPMYEAPYYRGSGKLEGMKAIVTGGDSGIGRAVAILFAREGADVVIAHLAEDKDAEQTRAAVEDEGQRAVVVRGDVRDKAFCEDLVRRAVGELGGLDILVNNAAFQMHTADFATLSEKHLDETLKTNLYGYFFLAQAAVPHMKPGGSIINTGSVAGIEGSAGPVDYSMSKGGIHAFTRALSGHVLKQGIRVNCVAPGPVWTPLNPSDRPPEEVSQFGAKTPMKRPAQPEEIAPAFVFLASPQTASYITGEILPIVGGY